METAFDVRKLPAPSGSAPNQKTRGNSKASDVPPLSIYHEPWWLDIATDGQWGEATVVENGAIVGRMPYPIETRKGLRISRIPSLIRTLGPAVLDAPGKPVAALRRRLEITSDLIGQLPSFDLFEHFFDPSVPDAVSFIFRGFITGTTYGFRIDAGLSEAQVWSGMNDKTRNVIRKSGKGLVVARIERPDDFAQFYESNLAGEPNRHTPTKRRCRKGYSPAIPASCLVRTTKRDASSPQPWFLGIRR